MQRLLPKIKPLSAWTYVISLALWLSLCIGAAATVIVLNVRDVEKGLLQYGDAYSGHLNQNLVSSETILKGFAALFGAIGRTEPDKASRYVRQVIESNPQIFALEIVQTVEKDQLADFVAGKRRSGIPGFTVKSFSYDSDRKWEPLKEKPVYYPLVFMEPMPPGSADVLGLDMESVPFLRGAMAESLQRRAPAASQPFRLVEGNLAYVVFCPIAPALRLDHSPVARTAGDYLMVAMVIDAAKLTQPSKVPVFDGGAVIVYQKDFRHDDPKGQLLAMAGKTRSPIESAIFPAFVYKRPLATMGEPFALMATRQVGWSDLNLGLLALIGVLTFASSLMLIAYLRAHQHGRVLQMENQEQLWRLANHDGLTGLPNRMLLMDRMQQLLAKIRRQGGQLAVMFLDLNDFKQVNDTYGHEAGDRLLKGVAERLRAAVRGEDTVARISGDEFVILIEGAENLQALEAVSQQIQLQLSEGFPIEDRLIHVHLSMGIAIFPEDGDSPGALIKRADMRMYADKQPRAGKLHPV